ncbi:MAG: GIY-YIG nuclease family protein [Candidatus Bathyarchaeota archaeon]
MALKGTYLLCIRVKETTEIKIGALGLTRFPHGRYVYVGSALNSLEPRINRHIKTSRGEHHVTHWHIDYLLREPATELEAAYFTEAPEKLECEYASAVADHGTAVKGFGCTDCRCVSHLYKVDGCGFIEKMGLRKWARGSPQLPG